MAIDSMLQNPLLRQLINSSVRHSAGLSLRYHERGECLGCDRIAQIDRIARIIEARGSVPQSTRWLFRGGQAIASVMTGIEILEKG